MEEAIKNIENWAQECIAEDTDLFLVDIIKKGNSEAGKVVVLVDGDNGVPIEKCVKISRNISRRLDEEMELTQPLTLEVSSPGLDHPLKSERQYVKNIGKSVCITLKDHSQQEGVLVAANDQSIELDILIDKKKKKRESKSFSFKDINKTIVLVSFK